MKEIVNNTEDSKFSDDKSQCYDIDMLPENISSPISSESEKDICSEVESDIQPHSFLVYTTGEGKIVNIS